MCHPERSRRMYYAGNKSISTLLNLTGLLLKTFKTASWCFNECNVDNHHCISMVLRFLSIYIVPLKIRRVTPIKYYICFVYYFGSQ